MRQNTAMETVDIIEVIRGGIWTIVKMGAPVLLMSLGVGLIVSLFQALTQIQEMTLAFIPKIMAVFITLVLFMPFMLGVLKDFTLQLYDRI